MKSNEDTLAKRGFLAKNTEIDFSGFNFEEKIKLLQSPVPVERTIGARSLLNETNNPVAISSLIQALKTEKKLYPKIEICNTLSSYGEQVVEPLIKELGTIGANQHQTVPQIKFKKVSFPLPRDIISRTLAYMGPTALPGLVKVLENGNEKQISETIDAIGYICFYNYDEKIFRKLKQCFFRYKQNELISWKIIRAMSAFPESKSFLREIEQQYPQNEGIKIEIERSLKLIEKRQG